MNKTVFESKNYYFLPHIQSSNLKVNLAQISKKPPLKTNKKKIITWYISKEIFTWIKYFYIQMEVNKLEKLK